MTIDKFLSMLEFNALFFARADKLTREMDVSSGIYEREINFKLTGSSDLSKEQRGAIINEVYVRDRELRKRAYISSWIHSQEESIAMWSIYGGKGPSIAIKTTVDRLSESISQKDVDILLSKVQYYSTNQGPPLSDNLIVRSIHKPRSFEYEQEVRAIILASHLILPERKPHVILDSSQIDTSTILESGMNVGVNVKKLVEKIFISPYSEDWFEPLVKAIMKKYELGDIEVMMSAALKGEPKIMGPTYEEAA
jgi:hypothetical protein